MAEEKVGALVGIGTGCLVGAREIVGKCEEFAGLGIGEDVRFEDGDTEIG